MKKIIPFFLIFFTSISYSQTVDLSWGVPKKLKPHSKEYGFVGQKESFFYTLNYDDKKLFLTKSNKGNLSKVFEKEIAWDGFEKNNNSKNITFKDFISFKDNFVLFINDEDKKNDKRILYGQKVNYNGDFEGPTVKLDEKEIGRKSKEGSMDVIYCKDSSKFLIVKNPNFEKYAAEKFRFKIFDSNLKSLHSLEVELPFKDKFFVLNQVKLASTNVIYLLAKIEIPRADAKKDEARHYYEIVRIDAANGGKVKMYDVKLDGKDIQDISMQIDKEDNIKCIGFYADINDRGKTENGINGVFYFALNSESSQIETPNIKEFSKALVTELSGKRRANKDKGIESTFKLKYFLEKEDKSFVALMEEDYYVVTTSTISTGNGGTSTTTTYHYYNNEILAINITPEGKISWFVTIPKNQHSVNDSGVFNSFYATYANGKIYIVYNDNKENAINKDFKNTVKPFRSVPVLITLDQAGKYQKTPIGDITGKNEFMMKPEITTRIDSKSALFYAYHAPKACSCTCLNFFKPRVIRFGLFTIK